MVRQGGYSHWFKALNPEYIQVDERNLRDRLGFAGAYTALINFYDQNNGQNGSWQDFFVKDPLILLALISRTEYRSLHAQFMQLDKKLMAVDDKLIKALTPKSVEPVIEVVEPDYPVATATAVEIAKNSSTVGYLIGCYFSLLQDLLIDINGWMVHCRKTPQSFQLKSFIEHKIKTTISVDLQSYLALQRVLVKSFADEFAFADDFSQDFDSDWVLNGSLGNIAYIYKEDKTSGLPVLQPEQILPAIRQVFQALFGFYVQVIDAAKKAFDSKLDAGEHYPDTTLLISFCRLLDIQQQQQNQLTKQHLDFYYQDILKLAPAPAIADHAFICADLVKNSPVVAIPAGDQFNAGPGTDHQPLIFANETAKTLNTTKISEAITLNYQSAATPPMPVLSLNKIAATDNIATDKQGQVQSWPLFGNQQGTPITQGVSFASPMLALQSGVRTITLTLGFAKGIAADYFADSTFYLSTAKGWFKIGASDITAQHNNQKLIGVGNDDVNILRAKEITALTDESEQAINTANQVGTNANNTEAKWPPIPIGASRFSVVDTTTSAKNEVATPLAMTQGNVKNEPTNFVTLTPLQKAQDAKILADNASKLSVTATGKASKAALSVKGVAKLGGSFVTVANLQSGFATSQAQTASNLAAIAVKIAQYAINYGRYELPFGYRPSWYANSASHDATLATTVAAAATKIANTSMKNAKNANANVAIAKTLNRKRLKLIISLKSSDPAITALTKNPDGYTSQWPLFKMTLGESVDLTSPPTLNTLSIDTNVSNTTDLVCYAKAAKIKLSNAFNLFGPIAEVGDSFYLGSSEIFAKPLQSLTMALIWDKLPEKLSDYYAQYNQYLDPTHTLTNVVFSNDTFKVDFDVLSNGQYKPMTQNPLISPVGDNNGDEDKVPEASITELGVSASTKKDEALDPSKTSVVDSIKKLPSHVVTVLSNGLNRLRGKSQQLAAATVPVQNVIQAPTPTPTPTPEVPKAVENPIALFQTPSPPPTPPAAPLQSLFDFTAASLATSTAQPDLLLTPLTLTDKSLNGFLRVKLTQPYHGFGNDLYAKIVAQTAMENALIIAEKAAKPPSGSDVTKTTLYGTILKAVKSAHQTQLTSLTDAQAAVTQAQTELTTAITEQKKAQTEFDKIQPTTAKAIKALEAAKTDLTNAKKAVAKTQAKLTKAQKKLTAAQTSSANKAEATSITQSVDHEYVVIKKGEIKPMPNPPYTPKVASLAVSYDAQWGIDLTTGKETTGKDSQPGAANEYPFEVYFYDSQATYQVYTLNKEISSDKSAALGTLDALGKPSATGPSAPFPLFAGVSSPGTVYLALENVLAVDNPVTKKKVVVPCNLTLYFELAQTTVTTELDWYDIKFNYLSMKGWKKLKVLNNPTKGFDCSGIIEVTLTEALINNSPLMPSGSYWLSITAQVSAKGKLAGAQVVDIAPVVYLNTQALKVTRTDTQQLAIGEKPQLASGKITAPIVKQPQISAITQPFGSVGGVAPQDQRAFYQSTAQRIKTKDRAHGQWDYQSMAFSACSDLYFAKYITSQTAGEAQLGVIKTYADASQANAFEPMVSRCELAKITDYLKSRTSAFAQLKVINLVHQPINIVAQLDFSDPATGEELCSQITQKLKVYLSPWIISDAPQISIDEGISHAQVSNFLRTVPGVTGINTLKLSATTDTSVIQTVNPASDVSILTCGEPKITVAA